MTGLIDVLCVGHASYDLIFSVNKHPAEDEKTVADNLLGCGGGPAANAAVCVAKLGLKSAFAGYLGKDVYGDDHFRELSDYGVNTEWIVRGNSPTPLSAILVKPDGKRSVINYKGATRPLASNQLALSAIPAKTVLFDGHEPHISVTLAEQAKQEGIPTVLDAGSVHEGTLALMNRVDYLVCSEKFAEQYAGHADLALSRLAEIAPNVVITLGERGLIWQRGAEQGNFPAYPVQAIDTTGAGDAFHGAFAAALTLSLDWESVLRYAGAAGSLCCTRLGARTGLPAREEHARLFNQVL